MIPDAPIRGTRRGRRRVIWITLIALLLGGLLSGNLWLASPPGCQWVATKIHRLTGLETTIGRVSCWPWNGVCLRQVELLQPAALRLTVHQPLARIAAIRLTPVWHSWRQGHPEMRVFELDSPQLVIPLEMIADLARSQTPPAPLLAAVVPEAALPVPPTAPMSLTAPAPPTPPAAPTAPALPTAPHSTTVVLPPTAWLNLTNASLTLVSAASGKTWLHISGLNAAIPISGRAAESSLDIASISLADQAPLTGLHATTKWTAPVLALKPFTSAVHGCQFTIAAKIAILNNLPVQIEAQIPRQQLSSFPVPAAGHVAADSIAADARFRGLLLAPGTWYGDFVAEANAPAASIAGHQAKFDRGRAITILRGGLLSCLDARLIGDDLSLLGNATLLADGRLAAALRVVAPPETAAAIINHVFHNSSPAAVLSPLSTPQRAAMDVAAFGNLTRIFLQLGKDGTIMELK